MNPQPQTKPRVLVISGSMGSGKTTVMGEASDLLAARHIPHAAFDLDAFGVVCVSQEAADGLLLRNLATVWQNYAAVGIDRMLLAWAMESSAEQRLLQQAIPGAETVVCRLHARLETMQQRVRQREPGMLQERFVARTAELEAALDRSGIEDFRVNNDHQPVTEVAREILVRAGWL